MGFQYHRPQSLDEARQLQQQIPGARLIAGGTDMMVRIKNNVERPPALISLRAIPELHGIESGGTTCIGATTTVSELLEHPVLARGYPVLVQGAGRLGSVQIRNAATIGGNLCNCSPCADTAPPLLVLGAKVGLHGPEGLREAPIREFFRGPGQSCLAPGEMLSRIVLPPPEANGRGVFLKKGRVKMDLSLASLAIYLELEGDVCLKARLAAGSVAPTPLRLIQVEDLLTGNRLTEELLHRAGQLAAESVSPISDVRASADYRRELISVYLKRGVRQILGGEQ